MVLSTRKIRKSVVNDAAEYEWYVLSRYPSYRCEKDDIFCALQTQNKNDSWLTSSLKFQVFNHHWLWMYAHNCFRNSMSVSIGKSVWKPRSCLDKKCTRGCAKPSESAKKRLWFRRLMHKELCTKNEEQRAMRKMRSFLRGYCYDE